MDLSFILAAAEAAGEHAAEEEHKSELPFFIAGGALAVFAVAISIVGFKRPDFPGDSAAARGVMALSIMLVAVTMGATIYVSN
jgi:hypothetical protein